MNKRTSPSAEAFMDETAKLAESFGWEHRSMDRGSEMARVARVGDAAFDRFIWTFDSERVMSRTMLVGKDMIGPDRRAAIFELCARVNEGLPFGCIEYSFDSNVVVFRDSVDLDWGPLEELLSGSTSRALNLAQRYGPAVRAVLGGTAPEKAMEELPETE